MKIKYQVTLFDKSNRYKPVSCIIQHEPVDLSKKADRQLLVAAGTIKICQKRYWSKHDLKKYNLLVAKVREVVDNTPT